MVDEERQPMTKPVSDTLTSSRAPSGLRPRPGDELAAPRSGAAEPSDGPERRSDELDQRLADCEIRIAGLYDRLAALEKERSQNDDRSARSTKILVLWVLLIFLFVVIWNFLGPGSAR